MLNEIEIVAWYTFLKRSEFNVKSAESVINSTAFCAKELLNGRPVIAMFEAYFTAYNKQFLQNYREWWNGPGERLAIKPVEVNEVFTELWKPFSTKNDKDFVDYNFLVDEIL